MTNDSLWLYKSYQHTLYKSYSYVIKELVEPYLASKKLEKYFNRVFDYFVFDRFRNN